MRPWSHDAVTPIPRRLKPFRRLRHTPLPPIPEEYREPIARWSLRLLATGRLAIEDDELAGVLGTLTGLRPIHLRNPGGVAARRAIGRRLAQADAPSLPPQTPLARQLRQLADLVGLSDIEQALLGFTVLAHACPALGDILEALGSHTLLSLSEVLAVVLGTERQTVHRILCDDSPLCAAGLLRVARTETDVVGMLDLLDGLDTGLLNDPEDGAGPFRRYCEPASASRHRLEEFAHLREHIEVLQRLLGHALAHPTAGVNILVYGDSGTGKTEFVKALAASLEAALFQVGYEGDDQAFEPVRFRSYLFTQTLLARNDRSLVLFDEVEDVFPALEFGRFGIERRSGRHKAWTNAALERNPRPAFWVCNQVRQIDPAFRRRFVYALEMRTPPRSVRRAVLAHTLHPLPVRSDWLDRMACHPALTPAVIAKAATVAAMAGGDEPAEVERLVERTIRQTLDVLEGAPLAPARPEPLLRYSVDHLHASHDLQKVVEGLAARPTGRLCLYGPPGSGKTAFAHYLAEQLDRPLLDRRASDLLSCWVGETERNLARLFQEALDDGAVLLLDEADSFLQDRRGAQRSWEVTQVNELLKQMEAFEGICVCATNVMDELDPAVLRRFDLKIQFRYLTAEQAFTLFVLALASTRKPGEEFRVPCWVEARLDRLTTLTPGDFTTVLRQGRLLGVRDEAETLLAALEAECRAKDEQTTRRVGFCADLHDER